MNTWFTSTPDKLKLNHYLIFTLANYMHFLWQMSFVLDYMLWSKHQDNNKEISNKVIRFQINLSNFHFQLILVFIRKLIS